VGTVLVPTFSLTGQIGLIWENIMHTWALQDAKARVPKPASVPVMRAMSKDWPEAHQWHEQGVAAWQAEKPGEAWVYVEKAIE
jgi:hypothetical protein